MTKDSLLRRARIVARLHHPNLAPMLPLPGGAGLTPVTLGARRLAEFSTPDGAFVGLELERVIWLVLDVLGGLRALHELTVDGAGFVHGSISPQYVLLGEPGDARLVPITSAHLNAGSARETSGYAAPEALSGHTADLRADLFSVGVLLWEALAQQRLFPDGSRDAVVARLAGAEVPALRDLLSVSWALPLCQVAERAISIDPSARYRCASDLSSAIVAAVGPRLTSPHREGPARWFEAPAPVPLPAPTPRTARWRTTTPLSVVIDLPQTSPGEAAPDSEPGAAPSPPQPELSPHWQRWRPVLAGLAGISLACALWQLAPRRASPAAAQPSAAAVLTPAVPAATLTSLDEAAASEPRLLAPPAPSAASTPRPFGAPSAATSAVRNAAPRKPRPTVPPADGDYGI
jgi:eukaryotic-like serine/threonine-protein kinase